MKTLNPWKTLSSKIVYRNPWITVREDDVIRPDGQPGIYGVVESRIATGAVAITPEEEVYLVGQFRYATNVYSWEIIEGGTEDGETPLFAAERELREEAGILAREWSQLGGEIHLSNCHSSERALLFLAEDLEFTTAEPEGTEELQLKKLPLSECLALVDSGEIKDAMTIMGLTRVEQLLKERKKHFGTIGD